jgi:DNA-binding transcriptional ArsR family regulator
MTRSRARAAALADAAPVFHALGDRHRLRIVARLSAGGPLSIARLTEGETITRQAVTKHLQALAHAGLVKSDHSERDRRERIWELQPRRLAEVRRYLAQISAEWDEAIGRLRALVEDR